MASTTTVVLELENWATWLRLDASFMSLRRDEGALARELGHLARRCRRQRRGFSAVARRNRGQLRGISGLARRTRPQHRGLARRRPPPRDEEFSPTQLNFGKENAIKISAGPPGWSQPPGQGRSRSRTGPPGSTWTRYLRQFGTTMTLSLENRAIGLGSDTLFTTRRRNNGLVIMGNRHPGRAEWSKLRHLRTWRCRKRDKHVIISATSVF